MPELPEVETVKRTLSEIIIDEEIKDVIVSWPKMIKAPDDVDEFIMCLIGQSFRSIERKGKFLVFSLDDHVLVSHLRMEGRYGLFKKEDPVEKHTHVRFIFQSGRELRYKDVRKFGTMHLFNKGEEMLQPPLSKLGIEPLEEEFTSENFGDLLKKTTRNIKSVLLDQSYVVGIGNIYADESLFRANIHPERMSNELTEEEVKRLHESIVKTLKEAVKMGGSTIKSYVNGQGEMGMFQQVLNVYGRKGEACKVCGTEINRTVVAGRGTHYCAQCQAE